MANSCSPPPVDKKKYIEDLGQELVLANGKKEYYSPEEVKKAHKMNKHYVDFHCWGMSTYCSHSDFDEYHQSSGENCDYVEMKAEMLGGISTSDSSDLLSLPDFDIDMSWLELSSIGDTFEPVLDGIGTFFSALLEVID